MHGLGLIFGIRVVLTVVMVVEAAGVVVVIEIDVVCLTGPVDVPDTLNP